MGSEMCIRDRNMDGLLQMDLTTGDILLISSWPLGFDPNFLGIAAETDSTFFLIENPSGSLLYWNIDANTIIDLGPVGVNPWADLCLADGQYYTSSAAGIWNINVNDPGSSSLIIPYIPPYRFSSLSASIYCHTLVAILSISNGPEFLAYVSLIDGAIKQICQVSDGMHYLTSELEFISPTVCDNTLDLDCNDSSLSLIHI